MATDMVFSAQEVKSLNAFQRSGKFHPFTCGGTKHYSEDEPTPMLLATIDGWVCPDPHCDYRQVWAHDFMKTWDDGGHQ